MDKPTLKAALLSRLDDDIEAALASSRSAQETASHEDNKPENQYDTLALEAAYLAHGQSERILRLQKERISLAKWPMPEKGEPVVRNGSLLKLISEDDETRWLFITPVGGYQLLAEGQKILVISQQTPLAKKLMGKEEGEALDLTFNGVTTEWELAELY